jgi:hypothetical protein
LILSALFVRNFQIYQKTKAVNQLSSGFTCLGGLFTYINVGSFVATPVGEYFYWPEGVSWHAKMGAATTWG